MENTSLGPFFQNVMIAHGVFLYMLKGLFSLQLENPWCSTLIVRQVGRSDTTVFRHVLGGVRQISQ